MANSAASALEINGQHIIAQFADGQRELWFTLPKGYEHCAIHVLDVSTMVDEGELTRRAVGSAVGRAVVRAMQKKRSKENLYCTQIEEDRIAAFVRENFETLQRG